MDDGQFRALLEALGYSWRGYRKVRKGVKRRIRRHMQQRGCGDLRAYLELLARERKAREEADRCMAVSISRFFRDRRLWEQMEKFILPELARICGPALHVWCGGCACGEEVYSLRICWEGAKPHLPRPPRLVILATDLSPSCLERARAGIYARSSLKELPEALVERYFHAATPEGPYTIKEGLRSGIQWQIHDLRGTPPRGPFHLIFMRNHVLTYLSEDLGKAVLDRVAGYLVEGGFLVIGSHEQVPEGMGQLRPVVEIPGVFRHRPGG